MGVPGLWNLLEPARRPLDLEQLSGKIVAIDMNIWLHQAVKSRASTGGPSRYLSVLFRRLCKLIYFGIRPVFVFDGEVPTLKKSTIAARRQLRTQLGEKAERAEQRMLRRLLRRVAESAAEVHTPNSSANSHGEAHSKGPEQAKVALLQRLAGRPDVQRAKEDAQLFDAPPGKLESKNNDSALLHESAGLEFDDLARDYLDSVNLYAPSDGQNEPLDLHSPSFCALPVLAQLRVIQLAREQLESGFRKNCQQQLELERDNEVFSANQVHRLLLRRRLAERHEELSVQIAKAEAAHQLAQLNNPHLLDALRPCLKTKKKDSETVTSALRIQSRDTGHAILIKKPSPQNRFALNRLIERDKLDLNAQDVATDKEHLNDVLQQNDDLKDEVQSTSCISVEPLVEHEVKPESVPSSSSTELMSNEDTYTEHFSAVSSESTSSDEASHSSFQIAHTQLTDLSCLPATPNLFDNADVGTTGDSIPTPETLVPCANDSVPRTTRPNPKAFSSVTSCNTSLQIKNSKLLTNEDDEVEEDFIEVSEPPIATPSSDEASNERTVSSDEESQSISTERDITAGFTLTQNWIEDADEFRLDDEVLREQADRFARQAQTTTTRCIEEAQQLLRLFGVPFLIGPEEAEAQCASLQRSDRVDFVATDDSDVWPFGAQIVCRHLFGDSGSNKSKTKNGKNFLRFPSLYLLEDVQQRVGLNVPNFLRLALLCGSDYTLGVQNVGPVTAIEILSEFDPQENACSSDWHSWLNGSDASDDLVVQVIEPLHRFVAWWKVATASGDPKTSTASPLKKKWLKLSLPPGFPDSRIVEAYLRPNVMTHTDPFVWRAPDVESLVRYPFQVHSSLLASCFLQCFL
ncbi:unnamed protein product [Dicrocoelium dendriticum]|nr:unnamed protein product [Dicrocoelium dendriticum]